MRTVVVVNLALALLILSGCAPAPTAPRAMAAAGLDPESFYLTWNLADAWRDSHPDSVPRLVAAIDEAVQLLETDDAVWPDLAKRSGVTDPQLLPAFVRMQRDSFRT